MSKRLKRGGKSSGRLVLEDSAWEDIVCQEWKASEIMRHQIQLQIECDSCGTRHTWESEFDGARIKQKLQEIDFEASKLDVL